MHVPKKGAAQYLLWLWIAENEDLFMAKLALKEEQGIGSAFFHLQQCVEKSLKAFLSYKKHALVKTHDLSELLALCKQYEILFERFSSCAVSLNPYCTQTRYPCMHFFIPDIATLKVSIDEAEKILNFVKERIVFLEK